MWTPKNINEWLTERISFNEKSGYLGVDLINFKYCQKLYNQLLHDPKDEYAKSRFRNVAYKIIFDTLYELDKQEYKCIRVHYYCWPTDEKENLPQENINNIKELRTSLEIIFYQVRELCGGGF